MLAGVPIVQDGSRARLHEKVPLWNSGSAGARPRLLGLILNVPRDPSAPTQTLESLEKESIVFNVGKLFIR